LCEADIPNMPMNSPQDLLQSPQLRSTGFVRDTVHPTEGAMHVLAHPTRWSATPPAREFEPAPQLGQHTVEVLQEAGFSREQIEQLLATGACRGPKK
jgi:crotonobetainyl-CoA:carnitine CoA-transferase CaiB-like acyl-CoA transferase